MMQNQGESGQVKKMRKIGGMRGMMEKKQGEIIEKKIIQKLKEGMKVKE